MTPACDLCGAREARQLQRPRGTRALRSDRRVIDGALIKVECARCGLVRDGSTHTASPTWYRDEYQLDEGDHIFRTAAGDRRRSAVFADWIARGLVLGGGPHSPGRVLEIGASRGYLLAELASRWPAAKCQGVELGADAAAEARARGLDIHQGDTSELPSAAFDLVCSVAVLEHVPSPAAFLAEMRRLLAPDGFAILIQPTQDVPSYDVLFVDHLHHFATAHLRGYAARGGFRECHAETGLECMPNFSGHVWKSDAVLPDWQWRDAPAPTSCARALSEVLADMDRADHVARHLHRAGRPFGVFGLHEVFAVARAYSSIEAIGIACGLDDAPDKAEYRQYGFPVVRPEACQATGVRDVFLTMNRIYYSYATERLAALGLAAHPVLS